MNDEGDISNDSIPITGSPEGSGMPSWNITNTSLAILPAVFTARRADAVAVRNLMVGGLGILFNSIAIAFLCITRNVKPPIKVTMIGMTLNDLCFTANGLVLGNPVWVWISDAPYCWPAVYFVVSPMVVSNLTTVLLALHNFVAVAYPLHCDLIMTRTRSLLSVMACWVIGFSVAFGCLGTAFPKGLLCFVLIVVPRYGLAVFCGSCLVCCGVIVALNVIIVKKVKESGKMLRHNQGSQSKNMGCKAKHSPTFSHEEHRDGQRNFNAINVINLESMNSRISALTNLSNGQLGEQEPVRQQGIKADYIFSVETCPAKMFTNQPDIGPKRDLTSEVKRSHPKSAPHGTKSVTRNQSRTRRVKTTITLTMLTFWSCFLSLPLVVFMVYVALLAPDRQVFTTSTAGYLIVFVSVIHSVGNPLLYAWRFMDWRNIRSRASKVNGCC